MQKQPSSAEIEAALQEFFKAYDMDESGELSRQEFIKAESGLSLEGGCDAFGAQAFSKLTLSDKDHSGTVDFEEFRVAHLKLFLENDLTNAEVLRYVKDQTKKLLVARARMGPRYHAGIRKALKKIFWLYDVSGDGFLSPEEWISAQRVVALEISDDIDESWIDENAFNAADANGDGVLELDEFLEASFSMFEVVKGRTEELLETLTRVADALQAQRNKDVARTRPLTLWQQAKKPDFKPPSLAWQDEATDAEPDKNADAWEESGEIVLPTDLQTQEEVAAAVRLSLKMPVDTWLSLFYLGPNEGGAEGSRSVCRVSTGNVEKSLDYFTKPNADNRLYVKNVRKIPSKLKRVQQAFLGEREALLAKHTTGIVWGLDWETQTVGDGVRVPWPMVIAPGDIFMVEVPQSDENCTYRFVSVAYMDGTEVLSQPCEQDVEMETKKKKKKKKKGAAEPDAPPPDMLLQMSFVALQEGKCVLFVEVSWEDQEEKLAGAKGLRRPVAENTVARIGPIEVTVQKAAPANGKADALPLQWWNGDKWTAKKGPAKKGKKK
eukprot:TRINITY_DN45635_c0_g1_i1.p1 TRINITY_DN45635_c0_g1~~TRINITY_DN45635_c0_g1_i1.p1  ORF type:complete len:550 (-),score=159.33 TRINITY_DN45635_c0_g1_i1:46-1695(-)